MKSDLPVLSSASPRTPDRGHEGLGYPSRLMIAFAAVLALAVVWLVLPLGSGVAWAISALVGVAALAMIAWHTRRLARARGDSAHVLA
ncbi:MAG: OmpA family protein, partial [Burkholderia vietnamiensis]|nr:OmpA family protein [Burkholderia vietnamiensis]